jgi:hypothetical protein
MAGLPRIAAADVHRVRPSTPWCSVQRCPTRAAIRLTQRGARVPSSEEAAARRTPAGATVPALGRRRAVCSARVSARSLAIDRPAAPRGDDLALRSSRRIRGSTGNVPLAAAGVAWGFAKPDEARAVLAELAAEADATRDTLLAGACARSARRSAARSRPAARGPSALPGAPELRAARSGAGAGRGRPPHEPASLRARRAARRRRHRRRGRRPAQAGELAALFGERRAVPGPFRLVAASHLAAVEVMGIQEIWAGRALVLNAPREALAQVHDGPAPALLRAAPSAHRRVGVHLRAPSGLLPEAMARRVVVVEGHPARGATRSARSRRRFVSTVTPRDAEVAVTYARLDAPSAARAVLHLAHRRRPAERALGPRRPAARGQRVADPGAAGTRLSTARWWSRQRDAAAAAYGFGASCSPAAPATSARRAR